jgi:hypothetical protein
MLSSSSELLLSDLAPGGVVASGRNCLLARPSVDLLEDQRTALERDERRLRSSEKLDDPDTQLTEMILRNVLRPAGDLDKQQVVWVRAVAGFQQRDRSS